MSYWDKSVRDFFNFRPIFHKWYRERLSGVVSANSLVRTMDPTCFGIAFPLSSKIATNMMKRHMTRLPCRSLLCVFYEVAACKNRGPEATQTWIWLWPRRKKEVIKLQHFPGKRVKKKAKTSSEVKSSYSTNRNKNASWHRGSDATILSPRRGCQLQNRNTTSASL